MNDEAFITSTLLEWLRENFGEPDLTTVDAEIKKAWEDLDKPKNSASISSE
jgi:hypothetical protein